MHSGPRGPRLVGAPAGARGHVWFGVGRCVSHPHEQHAGHDRRLSRRANGVPAERGRGHGDRRGRRYDRCARPERTRGPRRRDNMRAHRGGAAQRQPAARLARRSHGVYTRDRRRAAELRRALSVGADTVGGPTARRGHPGSRACRAALSRRSRPGGPAGSGLRGGGSVRCGGAAPPTDGDAAPVAHLSARSPCPLPGACPFDDPYIIVGNPLIHTPTVLWAAFTHPYWPQGLGWGQFRPLVTLAFALDWAVSGGVPWWFHLVNIAWHAVASVLVWRLARTLLPSQGALVAALWFAVQPVHVEAVSSVVERSELMAATFVLAGLLAHRQGQAR